MRIIPIALLALAASCALTPPKDDFRQDALNETVRREGLWKGQGIHHYDFNFQRSCPCDPVANQPVTIHVRNDVITHVIDAQGAEVAPVAGLPWPTVDSLFTWAKLFLNDRSFAVEVSFDTTLNFPNHIQAQSNQNVTVIHGASNLIVKTATAPIVASYLIGAPASKSKSVTWRRR